MFKQDMTDKEYQDAKGLEDFNLKQILKSVNNYLYHSKSSPNFEKEEVIKFFQKPDAKPTKDEADDKAPTCRVFKMGEAIRKHPKYVELFTNGVEKQAVLFQEDNIAIKIRPDYWIEDKGILVAIQPTKDASPYGFSREIRDNLYHLTAALAIGICKGKEFWIVAVESDPPYTCEMYRLGNITLIEGRRLVELALVKYSAYMALDSKGKSEAWKGYTSDGSMAIDIPIRPK